MTDISKCYGKDCALRNTCYRFTAKANSYRQSYTEAKPVLDKTTGKMSCPIYWNNHIEEDK